MRPLILFIFLLAAALSFGQAIPEVFLRPDFSTSVGNHSQRPPQRRCIDFFDLLAAAQIPAPPCSEGCFRITDEIDRAAAFLSPVYNRSLLWEIHFPPGTYELTRQQEILHDNLVLRGAGADQTFFISNDGIGNCFNVLGRLVNNHIYTCYGKAGEAWLYLYAPPSIPRGTFAYLSRAAPAPSCKPPSVGQIVELRSSEAETFSLAHPLRIDFPGSTAQVMRPRRNVGFEDFTIDATGRDFDIARSQASNFSFQLTVGCWLQGVRSLKPVYQHVRIDKSAQLEVSGCYFFDAHRQDGGGGGRGYGTNFQNAAGECLVVDNIFERLRHAIVLQYGANGNAIAYNYTLDNEPEGDRGLEDLIFHGAYPFHNLVEGNSVEEIEFDLANGWNGPHNIIFRNQVRSAGIRSQSNLSTGCLKWSRTESIAAVGNITDGCVRLAPGDHFEAGNTENSQGCSNGEEGSPGDWPASLLFRERPGWLPPESSWPLMGPGSDGRNALPAGRRYFQSATRTRSAGHPCQVLDLTGDFRAEIIEDTCRGASGKIILLVAGGTPPYSITWPTDWQPIGDYAAEFFRSETYQVELVDATGQSLLLTGTTSACQPEPLPGPFPHDRSPIPFSATLFPNPTAGASQVRLWLPTDRTVSVDLYDHQGRRGMAILDKVPLAAGHLSIDIPSKDLKSGIYFCRIRVGEQVKILRLQKAQL